VVHLADFDVTDLRPDDGLDVRTLPWEVSREDVVERTVGQLKDETERVLLAGAHAGAVQVHDRDSAATCQVHDLPLERGLSLCPAGRDVVVVRAGAGGAPRS